jgi:phosphoribosylanthranilate isomerase
MFIKVCGITREEDAHRAIVCGAAALGFIFYAKSPRFIAPEAARKIIDLLPDEIKRVGVFVNGSRDELTEVTRIAGIDTLQLHGEEAPEIISQINAPVIKSVNLRTEADLISARRYQHAWALLVEGTDDNRRGGTGTLANWELAQRLTLQHPRVILSGGITPDNRSQAEREVAPYGLDLSSGIESAPGIKDFEKMKKFFLMRGRTL